MKIAVESIPAAGRQVTFDHSTGWAAAAATTSLDHPPTRLSGSFQLKKAKQGVVVVDLVAEAAAPATCDRCGEACEIALSVDTRLLYSPEETGGAEYDGMSLEGRPRPPRPKDEDEPSPKEVPREGIELEEQDLEVGWYRNGEVVLDDVLCEALALAAPLRIVCADTAECDRRTDALLAATQVTSGGPFAVLGALKRPAGEG